MDAYLRKARELERKLAEVRPLKGSAGGEDLAAEIAFLRRLFAAKALFEAERGFAPPLVAVVTGGTNVGKSEVFNAIAGSRVAAPDPRAGMTRRPAVSAPEKDAGFVRDPRFLDGYERSELGDPAILNVPPGRGPTFHYRLVPGGRLLLVDSPDVDSNRTENLEIAKDLLAASDAVVFVTSPSKYNDEACVRFLEKALVLGREVFVVFNFLGGEADAVIADFEAAVLAPRTAVRGRVSRVPRFPPGADVFGSLAGPVGPLAKALEALDPVSVKRAQAAASLAAVKKGFGAAIAAVSAEAAKIARFSSDAGSWVAEARTGYLAALDAEKYPEMESVFAEVLDHFKVPVVDDVLKAPGRVFKWIAARIQGEGGAENKARAAASRRMERDMKRIAETADMLRLRVLESLFKAAASDPLFAEVQKSASSGPLAGPAERRAEALWADSEPGFARWIDGKRSEMIEKIEASPNLKAFIKTSKAALQVGAGVAGVLITGGVGPTDLVTAPLAAKLMQYAIETFGSAYFQGVRSEYRSLHAGRFDAIVKRLVLDPLAESMPQAPDSQALEETGRALLDLEIPA